MSYDPGTISTGTVPLPGYAPPKDAPIAAEQAENINIYIPLSTRNKIYEAIDELSLAIECNRAVQPSPLSAPDRAAIRRVLAYAKARYNHATFVTEQTAAEVARRFTELDRADLDVLERIVGTPL